MGINGILIALFSLRDGSRQLYFLKLKYAQYTRYIRSKLLSYIRPKTSNLVPADLSKIKS